MEILKIKGLKKSYLSPDPKEKGERNSVIDISQFSMNAGEQMALKGSSGSGKTTFLNLISGILKPDSGEIFFLDQNIASLSESKRDQIRAKYMGYVFQTFNLLQGYTALENVVMGMMFGQRIDPAKAQSLLEKVNLKDRMNYLPRQLSVGQQQRVSVARALANGPKLVLADEPTGNLDQTHAAETIDLIKNICRDNNAALLLVTHDPHVLEKFARIEDLAKINHAAK